MNLRKTFSSLAIAGALSASVNAAVATVINYPALSGPGYGSLYSSTLGFTFTTGTGATVAPITSIRVYGQAPNSGTIAVNLYEGTTSTSLTLKGSDSLGFTATPSGDITLTGLSTTAGTIGAVSLVSNTNYVLTFSNSASGLFIAGGPPLSSTSDYTTQGGWSVVSSAYTLNGTTYNPWADAAVAITTGSPGPSSVPDNGSSFAGLGVAMAGLHLLRRRLPAALKR